MLRNTVSGFFLNQRFIRFKATLSTLRGKQYFYNYYMFASSLFIDYYFLLKKKNNIFIGNWRIIFLISDVPLKGQRANEIIIEIR